MWKIPKLSPGQLLDVDPQDILGDGYFRKCNTYKGGGGYDQFPIRAKKLFGYEHSQQFIVQIRGCNLDCPYCYVTRQGVWGEFKKFSSCELAAYFARAHEMHGTTVFHLMGGAPALQLKQWGDLLHELDNFDFDWVFHSDLMLTERRYTRDDLYTMGHRKALYAVNVKGLNDEEHMINTRKPFDPALFYQNLDALETYNIPFYFTFTNVIKQAPLWGWYSFNAHTHRRAKRRAEAFNIDLIDYAATAHVDDVEWGTAK